MSQRAMKHRKQKAILKSECRSPKHGNHRMNPLRAKLLKYITGNMAKYYEDTQVDQPLKDHLTAKSEALYAAKEFNQEWIDRSRGKGSKKKPHDVTFIKSVALRSPARVFS